ncbi:MAG: SpoIID/LytB domain-containing protein [Elusimicrobium sp.]|nr:SpoIID/LytB domain-containing protein [Elusimicrobium sp.]
MKKLFLFLTVFLLSANLFALRILIVENAQKQQITAGGPFNLVVMKTGKKYKLESGGTFSVQLLKNGKIKAGSLEAEGDIILKPLKQTPFNINGNTYTGVLTITPSKNSFNIIEETELEEYLYGVLPYEMSYSWPAEALKAQAVAARTYTARALEDQVNKSFDLYADVRSQMYKGSGIVYPPVKEAVDKTGGQVLKFENKLFYTYYHANCGGHTDPLPWNSPDGNIKPLLGVKCPYGDKSQNATWSRSFTNAEVSAAAAKSGLKGTITGISISKKTSGGRAAQLIVRTKHDNRKISCNDFRIAIGSVKFKSCMLTKIKKTSGGFDFEGKGYGHGTGMCQDSAKAMAERGTNYKDILKTFYPGAKLSKL